MITDSSPSHFRMGTMVTLSGVLLVLLMQECPLVSMNHTVPVPAIPLSDPNPIPIHRVPEYHATTPASAFVPESRDDASTLAFVIDLTGSMSDDLEQVKDRTSRILQKTLSRAHKPVQNFVLVGFNDPEVGPVTITTDPETFERELDKLKVEGGGDCPEMALGGIKEALNVSLPRSFIYVFADASAKDYHLLTDVLKLVEEKQSQVVFVLTGNCGSRTESGYTAYEEIADTSSGQVFNLDSKDEVNEVLKWVEENLQAEKVYLHSCNHDDTDENTWVLPFDSSLREVTVSLSGPAPQIHLTDPHGNGVDEEKGLTILLKIDSVLVVSLKSPTPGEWRLKVSSSGRHTLRVTGISVLNFRAGFSSTAMSDYSSTSAVPIRGPLAHVLLRVTGLTPPGNLSLCDLVSTSGRWIGSFIPSVLGSGGLWSLPAFSWPTQSFFIKVAGFNQRGERFQRISSVSYIDPNKPRGPAPTTRPTTEAQPLQIAELFCEPTEIRVGLRMASLASWELDALSGHLEGHSCANPTELDGIVWYRVERQSNACRNTLTTNSTHAIYSNKLYIYPTNPSFKIPASFPFSCAYPLNMEISLNGFYGRVQARSALGPQATASMHLFHTSNYTVPYPGGAVILPHGSALHVGVSVQWTDTDRFVLVLDNCYVTPSSSHNVSTPDFLIHNKCPVDPREVRVDENGVSLQARFSAQIKVSYLHVYLHCSLMLCDLTASSCTPTCSGRHARTVSFVSYMDIPPLTIGPISWQ